MWVLKNWTQSPPTNTVWWFEWKCPLEAHIFEHLVPSWSTIQVRELLEHLEPWCKKHIIRDGLWQLVVLPHSQLAHCFLCAHEVWSAGFLHVSPTTMDSNPPELWAKTNALLEVSSGHGISSQQRKGTNTHSQHPTHGAISPVCAYTVVYFKEDVSHHHLWVRIYILLQCLSHIVIKTTQLITFSHIIRNEILVHVT